MVIWLLTKPQYQLYSKVLTNYEYIIFLRDQSLFVCFLYHFSNSLVLQIGFRPGSYRVDEGDGSISLRVEVISGTISDNLIVPVTLTTVNDSATGKKQCNQVV